MEFLIFLWTRSLTTKQSKAQSRMNDRVCEGQSRAEGGAVVVVYGELKKKRISCYCCCCCCPEGIYRKFQRHYLWKFKIGVIYSCRGSSVMSWIPNAKSSAVGKGNVERRGRRGRPKCQSSDKMWVTMTKTHLYSYYLSTICRDTISWYADSFSILFLHNLCYKES